MATLRYAKTSTFATSHGPMYEVKLAALLFLRCKNSGCDFQIASNVDGAGALDDILVRYKPVTDPNEWHTYFLQLKHKQSAMVRVSSLSGGGGNFSLKKYLKSYIEIKDVMTKPGEKPIMFDGSFEKCTFVLYTNALADNVLSDRTRDLVLTQVEDMLKTDSGNGLVIKFSQENDPIIFYSIQEIEETFLEARGFLDKLKLFTGQATETQLDNLIKKELVVRFKGCLCVDVLYRYYEELIKEWCNNSDLILDQNCDFPERAFVDTISVKQQETFHLNVNFDDDFWESYSFDLTESVSLLQIDTCGLLVTCAKVLQYLCRTDTPFLFFGIESLLCEQNVVIPVWNCGSCDLLVIASDHCDQKQVRELFENICNVLERNPNKKVILLSRRGVFHDDLQLQILLGTKFKSKENNFRFSHLDAQSKDRILDRDLLCQGHSIALRHLFEKVLDLTETVCNAQLVETLLSNQMLTIGPNIDDVINFFIPRTLNWCNVLKEEILKAEELSDVFAVSGIAKWQLQDLAPSGEKVVHSYDPDCGDSRFVVLDSTNTEKDFRLICEKSRYGDVHWLHRDDDGHLRWRRSHGNIDLISQCVDENLCTSFHPDTALDITHRVVLVVAEPGMGKTTLVTHLARETKRLHPHLWVVNVTLKDHTRLLEEQPDVVRFLASAIGIPDESALEQSFFRFSLEHEGNVVVLLDGFDEISPSYAQQGCTLLDNLLKTRVKSVWVTSRQSMNNVLERNLSCLAFDMEKFTENDQKTFFKKSWANVPTPMTADQLDMFLTRLLNLLSRSLNDKEKHFTGIPLQTMMLAEVFEDYIKDPENNPLPERLNLLNLFETVIEKKFNVYVKKKSIAIDKNSAYETSELLKRLVKNHMNAALVLLVDEKEIQTLHSKEKIIKKTCRFLENITGSHDKTGIVDTVVNGKPHFIHRTFAEFFAAKWFSKHHDKNVAFLRKHLFGVHFKVVRDIFDRLLVRDDATALHSAILDNDVARVEALLTSGHEVNAKDAGGRSPLHLASSQGFLPRKFADNDRFIGPRPRHVTELLLDHGADVHSRDVVLGWTPLQYALDTNTWDAVEVLLQNNADTDNLSVEHFNACDQRLWGAIIENGFVHFMALLLDNGLTVETHVAHDFDHSLGHPVAMATLRYAKTSTFATSHGPMYEVKLAALLFLRCKNSGCDFQIASNVDGAGALDDILVRYKPVTDPNEWHTYFLQLKHKQSAMVRVSSLSGGGGNFSLKKYLKSYIEIKDVMTKPGEKPIMFDGSFEKCTFVLYTNALADDVLSARTRDLVLTQVEGMLKTDSGNGLVIKFSQENDPIIYNSIQEMEEAFLEARGFLDKLKLFTGQATETQLDNLIKKELAVRFKGCLCVDVLYRYYEELIKEWCNNSDLILDQNCDFPERAFVDTISVKQQETFHLNVNFADDFWETYSFDLTEGVCLLQIDTCGLLVTCAKVLQYLRRTDTPFLFFGIESLLCEQSVVIPVWNCGSCELLVIASDHCDQKQVRELFENICNVLERNPNKKVILLSRRGVSHDDLQLQILLGTKIKSKENNFRFSHLDAQSKDRILDRDLLFQGHSIALRHLFEKVLDLTETVCNAQLVETLLSNQMLTIGPNIDDVLNFFIPRTLNWCNVLKEEILKAEELSDVFAVSGIAKRQLQDLAPSGEKVVHSYDPDCGDSRFVVLDSTNTEKDFRLLCEKSRYGDVHWLHRDDDGHLRWRRSHGNIDLISQCVDENLCTSFHPDTALDITHRVVLVVAEPGMGKTTLVTHLARETKRLHPHLWVVNVTLKDHTRLLEEQPDVVRFLASAIGIPDESALEQSFFRFSLEHEGNVVVLLDGFDEISPSYAQQGCTLLDNLLKTRVKSVWVTSRQSMNNVLERNLSCLAFDMEKFTENDQKMFFKKSWANVPTPMTADQLDTFLTRLLNLLSRSLNDKEKHFTGIPLQTMMLAEVFEDYIKDPENNPLPERLNLLNLFETVIEKKFNVYVKKKSIAIDRNSAYETSELLKRLVKNHMNAALVLLVEEKEIQALHSKEKITKKTCRFLENITGSHDKTGIVDTVVNGKPHFIHRTFAEFFAAKWFSKHHDKNVAFLRKHLFGVHFKVVRDIFDRLLVRDDATALHSAILDNDVARVEALLTSGHEVNAKDAGGRSPLHLASSQGFLPRKFADNDRFIGPRPRHVTELLLDHGADVHARDAVLGWTPLQYALDTNTWDAVEVLLQNNADTDNLSVEHFNACDQRLWGAIIENGFVHFMTLLLDNGLPVESTFDDKHQLLHKAVIQGREKLVRLLISRGSVVKSCGYWEELLILASGYGHSHVVKILVGRLGEDRDSIVRYVNAKDAKGRSALSEASRFGHAEVVRYLASQGGDIWARDRRGETPLHRSAGQGNLSVVEALLAGCGRVANYIDARDDYHGWTSLHRAAEDKHTAVLRALIEQGGDIWARDEEGRTPLHVASERGHIEVVQELVKSLGGDRDAIVRYITSRDEEGRTPKEWTTDEERYRWSFEDECLAVAKWLDVVLKQNSSPLEPVVEL